MATKNNRFHHLFLLLLFVVGTQLLSAQQISITGTVTDQNGDPIIGASVIADNSGNGTATDIDGQYTIKADPLGQLRFSYIGYSSQTVNIEGRSTINVTMTENE